MAEATGDAERVAELEREVARTASISEECCKHGDRLIGDLNGALNLAKARMDAAEARAQATEADVARLKDAASAFLERYVGLINSGDAGFWDPEEEPEVIALRAALASQGSEAAEQGDRG